MFDNEIKTVCDKIIELKQEKQPLIVAIDGRCCAGKSTFASMLQKKLSCNLFHMDDFYLQAHQRTEERFSEPGGNVDRERFYEEVLLKIKKNEPFSYRPFDCHVMQLSDSISVVPNAVNIVEGSYSMHPDLADCYDLHVFLSVDSAEQLKRIEKRNPEKVEAFKNRWIPFEEKYFAAYDIQNNCHIVFFSG